MRLTVVFVFSFCFLCTSGASCGVACHRCSLLTAPPQLADIMAQQESGPSVSLAVCFSACDPNRLGLVCRDRSCQRSVFSGLAARAESARTPRRSVPDRHRAAASLGVSFLQLDARQSNFSEISRRPGSCSSNRSAIRCRLSHRNHSRKVKASVSLCFE